MEVDINGIGYKISGIAWRIKNEIIDRLRKLPVGAIVRKQKLDKERHELEQIRCRKKHRLNKRRNRRSEKQKGALDKIEKQNEEIIKLLNK